MAKPNYLNRPLADGIRKVGFRKWYERELLSSHAHMLLALFCAIALMGTVELFQGGTFGDKLLNVVLFIVSAVVGLWALRRYLYLLSHAEALADQANCPVCAAYGLLNVVDHPSPGEGVRVKCRKCSHEWTLLP